MSACPYIRGELEQCARGCKGFRCRWREANEAVRSAALKVVADSAIFDPNKPIHPSMQSDAWDDWKSIRDLQ